MKLQPEDQQLLDTAQKLPGKAKVRYRWFERAAQSPFRDDVTGTSPLVRDSCACKEGHKQPPNLPCTPGEAAIEMRRREEKQKGNGENPSGFLGISEGRALGRF